MRLLTIVFNYLGLTLLYILASIPLSWAHKFGDFLGWLACHLPIERRRVVDTNLKLCFKDLSDIERSHLARKHWKLLGRSIAERGYLWLGSERSIRKMVQIESEIDPSDGKPRLYVGMHMLGIEAGLIGLSLFLRDKNVKDPITVYVRMKNAFFDMHIKHWRERFGAKMVLRLKNSISLLREIRKGSFVLLSPDMDLGIEDSVFVPFFGVQTCTVSSISRLAQLGGSEVCPVVTTLNPDGLSYTCKIGAAWTNFPSNDLIADTTRMNAFFEAQIRPRPAEYYWVHKRFKNRPKGESKVY